MEVKNYIRFHVMGSFFSTSTSKEIDSWDVGEAAAMAEEYAADNKVTLIGFRFYTKEVGSDIEIKHSPDYYLGGTVKTLEDIEQEHNPAYEILLGNMKRNGWDKVIFINDRVYTLYEGDIVLSE